MAGKQKPAELSAGLLAVKGSAAPAQDMAPRAVQVPEPAAPEPEPELPLVESQASTSAASEAVSEPIPSAPAPVASEPEGDRNDAPLNFRVSPAFRREFKTYAAQNDLKLNELLRLAFDAYKARAS